MMLFAGSVVYSYELMVRASVRIRNSVSPQWFGFVRVDNSHAPVCTTPTAGNFSILQAGFNAVSSSVATCPMMEFRHSLLPHLYPDWFYLSATRLSGLSWKEAVKRV